jgi:hypothetical protein
MIDLGTYVECAGTRAVDRTFRYSMSVALTIIKVVIGRLLARPAGSNAPALPYCAE